MSTTVKGIYRNGRVELIEDPGISGEAEVVVTFMGPPANQENKSPSRIMTSGMLAVPGRRMSSEDDFKISEYDDSEWDRD